MNLILGVVVSGPSQHLSWRFVAKNLHFVSSLSNDLGIFGCDSSSYWKRVVLPWGSGRVPWWKLQGFRVLLVSNRKNAANAASQAGHVICEEDLYWKIWGYFDSGRSTRDFATLRYLQRFEIFLRDTWESNAEHWSFASARALAVRWFSTKKRKVAWPLNMLNTRFVSKNMRHFLIMIKTTPATGTGSEDFVAWRLPVVLSTLEWDYPQTLQLEMVCFSLTWLYSCDAKHITEWLS